MTTTITHLLDLIRKVTVAATSGLPAVIDAGRSLVDLVHAIAPTLGEEDQRKLQEALPALLAAMDGAVDQAVADLTGKTPPG